VKNDRIEGIAAAKHQFAANENSGKWRRRKLASVIWQRKYTKVASTANRGLQCGNNARSQPTASA